MYINKWASFASSVLLAVAGGSAYCWSIFSGDIKTAFRLSQLQLEEVANPIIPQLLCGWLSGFILSKLTRFGRLGSRAALVIGVVLSLSGYWVLYQAATGHLGKRPLWQITWLSVISAAGISWVDVTSITAAISNFPQHRGTVVGILKAVYGISASMFATVYMDVFAPHALHFMLFMPIAVALLALIALPTFNIVPFRQAHECPEHRFALVYIILGVIAIYQPAAQYLMAAFPASHALHVSILIGLVVTLLPITGIPYGTGGLFAQPMVCVPLPEDDQDPETPASHAPPVLVISAPASHADALHAADCRMHDKLVNAQLDTSAHAGPALDSEAGSPLGGAFPSGAHLLRSDDIVLAAQEEVLASEGKAATLAAAVQPGELQPLLAGSSPEEGVARGTGGSLLQSMASVNFWLLWLIFGSSTGCGLMLLINLGQLVESLGGRSSDQTMLLTLFSIFNALGRVIAGWLPERMLHKYGTPRPLWLVLGACGSALTTALAGLAGGTGSLQIAAPLIGVVYGAHQALMPVLTSELFDLERFAALYVILQQACLLGSYLLGTRLAGALYDEKAEQHMHDPNVCVGSDCFREAFLIAAACQAVATALAAALYLRTRHLYRQRVLEVHSADMMEAASVPDSPRSLDGLHGSNGHGAL